MNEWVKRRQNAAIAKERMEASRVDPLHLRLLNLLCLQSQFVVQLADSRQQRHLVALAALRFQ